MRQSQQKQNTTDKVTMKLDKEETSASKQGKCWHRNTIHSFTHSHFGGKIEDSNHHSQMNLPKILKFRQQRVESWIYPHI